MAFTLSGTVTDGSGAGLANALVKIVGGAGFGLSANTDPAGHYSIPNVPQGQALVEATSTGFVSNEKTVTISANTTLNFTLQPALYTVSGKVTDIATGAPIRNADVRIIGGGGFGTHVTTDANGNYTIPHLGAGRIIVEAYLSYQPKGASPTILSNTTLNFALQKN